MNHMAIYWFLDESQFAWKQTSKFVLAMKTPTTPEVDPVERRQLSSYMI